MKNRITIKEVECFKEFDICLNGKAIGSAEIKYPEMTLNNFKIYSEYQNKGYGQEAIRQFIDDFGVTNLWVAPENKIAKHIYEKNGFTIDDTPPFVAMRVKAAKQKVDELWRGKREDNGEWITGTELDVKDCTIGGIKVISGTVGICAGLPDKNGKLIWEKDIAKYGSSVGVVIYERGCCSLKYEYKNSVHIIAIIEKYDDYKNMEVIGNVCDNSELLEAEK